MQTVYIKQTIASTITMAFTHNFKTRYLTGIGMAMTTSNTLEINATY